jgi:hypothetical protein
MSVVAPFHIARPASQAYHRMLGKHGTPDDVATYRAWITWLRLHGGNEEALAYAVRTADRFAKQMGIP